MRITHTFLNMDIGQEAQWFPEYSVRLGRPRSRGPRRIDALRTGVGLYVRSYKRGFVAVNPTDAALALRLRHPAMLIRPIGGGALDGAASTRGWRLQKFPVRGVVSVPAHGGIVLLNR